MKLTPSIAVLSISLLAAGTAHADMDYHGFNKETVDALNERLAEPLTGEVLAVLSQHTDIEPCGGTKTVTMQTPDGWDARIESANMPGGDVIMPVPTEALAPDYPALYNVLGVEGVCEVMFDVNEDGATEEIMTNCTLPQFADATRAMIGPLEFTPGDGADTPATDDIIIPVQYCLAPDEE